MSEVSDAINEVRAELDGSASDFMSNTCSIIDESEGAQDSVGGTLPNPDPIAEDIPCDYEALKVPLEKRIGERSLVSLNYKLTLPANEFTLAILPSQKIVVDANGDVPELTFNDPVVLGDSLGPFVELAASLGN